MSRSMRQVTDDFRAAHPDPSDPVAHTLSVFADEPDDAFVIVASSNVYGDRVRTGLTWGDLRRLARPAVTPAPCGTCDRCPECVACHCPTGDHDSPFCAVCLNDGDADEWLGRQK